MRTSSTWAGAALLTMSLLSIGCGDDADAGLPSLTATKLIGAKGGTVELASGGKVEIPPGALSKDVRITVTELEPEDVTALPGNLEAAGKPFAFEPHGTVFASAVKVTLPFTGDASQVRPLKGDTETDPTWQTIVGATKTTDRKLEISTTSFSVYFATRPRRASGVITLDDGAVITPDAGNDATIENDAGTDAMVETDAGTDAMTDADAMVVVDRCGSNNGGCDPLSTCDDINNELVCGACPSDYLGSGDTGCTPTLTTLTLSVGTLVPALNNVDESYAVTVDLLVSTITLTPMVPAGALVQIEGQPVTVGQPWTSPVLTVGANTISIVVDHDGNTRTYTLVVTRDTGAQEAYVKSSVSHDMNFGNAVAIDGDTMVVGALRYAPVSARTGAAFVFVRSGSTWTQQAMLTNPDGGDDDFGYSVAIDGDTIVVGAIGEDSDGSSPTNSSMLGSGAAFVFVRNSGTWTQQGYLKTSNVQAFDSFGISVAVSGDTIAVGASEESSNATGINGNGTDNSASASGAAYVFMRAGGLWAEQAYVKASNTESYDSFGRSVALDGDTLVVGAYGESSAAITVNGDETDNTASGAGAAYVFTRTGTTWTQQAYLKAINTDYDDNLGFSLAVSGDTIVAGAPGEDSNAVGINGDASDNSTEGSGAAHVFTRNGTTWIESAYLKPSNTETVFGGETEEAFGYAVAIDGDIVIVGTGNEDSDTTGLNSTPTNVDEFFEAGAAYVYARAAGTWSQLLYVKASNTDARDQFGNAVDVSGGTFVCGADYEESAATGVNNTTPGQGDNTTYASGAVYVFR